MKRQTNYRYTGSETHKWLIILSVISSEHHRTKIYSALHTMSTRMAQAPEAPFAPGARHFLVQRLFSTAITSSPTSRWTAWTCAAPTELPQSRSRERGHARSWSAVDSGRRLPRGGGGARDLGHLWRRLAKIWRNTFSLNFENGRICDGSSQFLSIVHGAR